MSVRRIPVWMLFLLVSGLTGCNDTGQQRSLAVVAAEHFQTLYNTGSCEALYEDASPYFQAHEMRSRWFQDCAELRMRFGEWKQFTPAANNSWPLGDIGIVWVRGPARFANGPAEVRLDWDLSKDPPALFNLLIIVAGSEQISIPGFTGEVRR